MAIAELRRLTVLCYSIPGNYVAIKEAVRLFSVLRYSFQTG
jgi:hypothetical protein